MFVSHSVMSKHHYHNQEQNFTATDIQKLHSKANLPVEESTPSPISVTLGGPSVIIHYVDLMVSQKLCQDLCHYMGVSVIYVYTDGPPRGGPRPNYTYDRQPPIILMQD